MSCTDTLRKRTTPSVACLGKEPVVCSSVHQQQSPSLRREGLVLLGAEEVSRKCLQEVFWKCLGSVLGVSRECLGSV